MNDDNGAVVIEHHVWCNYWGRPIETCTQCKMLNEKYPMDGKTRDQLLIHHFPEVAELNRITKPPRAQPDGGAGTG